MICDQIATGNVRKTMVKHACRLPWLKGFLGLAVLLAGQAAFGQTTAVEVYPGVTRPSEERALSFSYPGVVREVLVKEGDLVKQGQPLVKLDDRLDQNALEQLKIDAESTLKVEYAEKSREQKQVRAKRFTELREKDLASVLETEEATLDAELAVTQLALSKQEHDAAKLKAAGQAIKVELATIHSTIDGIVQRISVKEGEYADPQQSQRPTIMVVKNDPMKVEVFVPLDVARQLSPGGSDLEVSYPKEDKWTKAQITFVDPVSDPGSGMRRLHLTMPNPENRPAGEQVKVRLPAGGSAAVSVR